MPDPIFSDDTFHSVEFALNGLAQRQEAIGRNLANVDTPGYTAQSVNFEDALKVALKGDEEKLPLEATHAAHLAGGSQVPTVRMTARTGGSIRADGNNVDLDVELNQMAETGIRYQALTQMASKKFLLLRTIISSR